MGNLRQVLDDFKIGMMPEPHEAVALLGILTEESNALFIELRKVNPQKAKEILDRIQERLKAPVPPAPTPQASHPPKRRGASTNDPESAQVLIDQIDEMLDEGSWEYAASTLESIRNTIVRGKYTTSTPGQRRAVDNIYRKPQRDQ